MPTSREPTCAPRGWRAAAASPNSPARGSMVRPRRVPSILDLPPRHREALLCPWLRQGHSSAVTSVAFSPDGRRLLSGGDDRTLRLWDAESGQEIRAFAGHQDSVERRLFARRPPPALRRRRRNAAPLGCRVGAGTPRLRRPSGYWCGASPSRPTAAACSPAATTTRFACGMPSRGRRSAPSPAIRLGDERRLRARRPPPALRAATTRHCASGMPSRGRSSAPSPAIRVRVWSVAFAPDGRRLLSGSAATKRCASGMPSRDRKSAPSPAIKAGCRSVAFSPDGRRLLSGSGDETLRLWDAESGQEIRAFAGHQGAVWSVAFSPDGRRLLSGGATTRCAFGMPSRGRSSAPSPDIRVR
jgi:hypothetical protein